MSVLKSVHLMRCVGSEDYTNKQGEKKILNHYVNNLGYLLKCVGSEKRTVDEKYPITLTLIESFKDGSRTQKWFYTEFKPDDLEQKEAE